MSWNYRVVKATYDVQGEKDEEVLFEIREVYYNKDGSIWAISENPITVTSDEGIDNMRQVLEWINAAVEKDVIDLSTVVFAEIEKDDEAFEETFSQELDGFAKPD